MRQGVGLKLGLKSEPGFKLKFNLLIITFDEGLIDSVVAAVAMSGALGVHSVALVIAGLARVAPQQLALIRPCSARALVAEGL